MMTMKVILLGNAGAGKSTLAKAFMLQQQAALLSLDDVAFQEGADRRPLEESVADVRRFIAENESWIIEGCYADIIEAILEHCEELIFLNPGVETCIAHCRARPWEPEKFGSSQEQNEGLEALIEWVRLYETRPDEYGLARHRALYESFQGKKQESNDPGQYRSSLQSNSPMGRGYGMVTE
jgi:adenylate kinase family enzyme